MERSSNAATYSTDRVVRNYVRTRGLFPAERAVVKRFLRQFSGNVLDIAVGAGRTTRVLARLSQRYTGIDYSPAMVAAAAESVPETVAARSNLRELDMREAPRALAGESFDAMMISFNGIDYIPWEDRNRLLAQLRPLLNENGVLVFSTHDLAASDRERGFKLRNDLRVDAQLLRRRPLSALSRLARLPLWLARALPNRWRNRPLERRYADHAYVNDIGENYGLLTTYVSKEAQVAALEGAGYRDVQVLHPWLRDREYASFNYFVCRPRRQFQLITE